MLIVDFIHSKLGIMVISFLWGLALATLFKKACQGPDCRTLEYRVPEKINGEVSKNVAEKTK